MALQYELFYVVGESQDAELPGIQEAVAKLVEAQGGTWLPGEMIERRKLAYAIKKETRGTYIAKRFTVPTVDERKKTDAASSMTELSRQLDLHKGVLRHILVRAEGLPALGERETVPQIARPGRRDDRRGGNDRRPDANQVREEAVDARLARKPEAAVVAAPAKEPVKAVEEVKPAIEEKVEVIEKQEVKKPAAKTTKKKVEEKTEEEAPKKRVTRKKKEVSMDEAEIDKKLDEVLNM